MARASIPNASACAPGRDCSPAARQLAIPRAVGFALAAAILVVVGCSNDESNVTPAVECSPEGASEPCYPGPAALRGIGECQDGIRVCRAGRWSDCEGHGLPVAEICDDERDDDCNGAADDGCPCVSGTSRDCYDGPATTRGVGACRDGVQACVDEVWAAECVGAVLPDVEGCDAADHDCDGAPDDACSCAPGETRTCYTGPAGTVGVGICHGANQVCEGPLWPTTCPGEVVPDSETCDSSDQDCDGAIDRTDCLARVERFWNTGICSHQYKAGSTTPDPGYVYEAGEHFYVYSSQVPGTVPLYQRSDGSKHLVTLDPDEGSASGYTQTETLGYVVPESDTPWNVVDMGTAAICRYTTTVCPDHVLWLASELPADNYTQELCLGFVWGWRS
jgi:hypothetical protein